MDIEQPTPSNQIVVRSFNEIEIEPSPINHFFYHCQEENLYVSRQKSTEVYNVMKNAKAGLDFHHIATLPWSKHVVKVHSVLLLFCPFQLRAFTNNSWQVHPFTTQLLSINVKKLSETLTVVYSFHQQQSIEYKISNTEDEEDFTMNFLAKTKSPFHVTKENIVEGFGKKIANNNKTAALTVCEFKAQDYVVVGDSEGAVHIYDFKTLGHLKSFKKHIGPILTMKIDEQSDIIFFSGSDSKVVAVCRVDSDWVLSGQVRGQSHDIFSLQIVDNFLISGGLTTDICCYPIESTKLRISSHQNRISYHSQNIVHSIKNYLLINKVTSFELWKIRQSQNDLEFLVRYQMPTQKFIKDIRMSKRLNDKTHLIIVSSQIDTVGWKFDEINGLVKLFTIKNSYDFLQFLPGKNVFVGLRDTGEIEKVHCKTGKIDEIVNSGISLPNDFKLLADEKLIVASNLTNQLKVFDLKKKSLTSKLTLNRTYQVICEKSDTEFLIKYVADRNLYACDFSKKTIEQTPVLQLPIQSNTLRYGGVLVHQSQVTKNLKKYWYFASENKIYLVNNLNNPNKKKSIRSIYTRQIGTLVKPKVNKSFQIGLVHLNFRRMVNNMEIKPVIAKKIT